MRLSEIYATQKPAISIEFFPPKTVQGEENLAERIPVFKQLNASFCSVTYGAGGSTREKTLWWAKRLKQEFGLEIMCHLTSIAHSAAELEKILEELAANGIENLMALRGDPPAPGSNWQPHPESVGHAAELVRLAKRTGSFSVAVAGFPETHPDAQSPEKDLEFLKQKVDAGADAIITQLFFDNADYYRYVESARRMGITIPIVPGILPFRTVAQLRKFTNLYARSFHGAARVPEQLEAQLAKVENDDQAANRLGIEHATEQCRDLLENGAPGVHFYCLNESHAIESILRNLNRLPA